jgi:hypothetical protein
MEFENTFDKLRDEFPVDLSEKVSELQAEIESLKAQLGSKWVSVDVKPESPNYYIVSHDVLGLYIAFYSSGGSFQVQDKNLTRVTKGNGFTHYFTGKPPKQEGWLRDSNTHVNKPKEGK